MSRDRSTTQGSDPDGQETNKRFLGVPISWQRWIAYSGIFIGLLVVAMILLMTLVPSLVAEAFIAPRIERAFAQTYPQGGIHIVNVGYHLWKNVLTCDSVVISTSDSTVACAFGSSSIRGIRWMSILRGGLQAPDAFAAAVMDIQEMSATIPRTMYEVRCERVHVSVPDSVVDIDSLQYEPFVTDEEFFGMSKFRTTRVSFTGNRIRCEGCALLDMILRKSFRARSVSLQGILVDVLTNKDQPAARDSTGCRMPGEILLSINEPLRIDTVDVEDGTIRYGERMTRHAPPALIALDDVSATILGVDNRAPGGTGTTISAQGVFMNGGTMEVQFTFPPPSEDFSLRYSGSLSAMKLEALNGFLERGELMRITSGVLHSATFDIVVEAGHAKGTVRAEYQDFRLAAIDQKTGSEFGFADGVKSFLANTFKIRGSNVPDRSGKVKLGAVQYVRKRSDPFFRFIWVSLRSGLGDVAGF